MGGIDNTGKVAAKAPNREIITPKKLKEQIEARKERQTKARETIERRKLGNIRKDLRADLPEKPKVCKGDCTFTEGTTINAKKTGRTAKRNPNATERNGNTTLVNYTEKDREIVDNAGLVGVLKNLDGKIQEGINDMLNKKAPAISEVE